MRGEPADERGMSASAGDGSVDAGACAAIVARDDPHLHATALFAPEPGRSRLMVLYAFDVELSRAALASSESLIPRMRLQWWRDVAQAARSGAPPPAHEVAGPFAVLAARALPAEPVEALIESREAELSGGFDEADFAAWADRRFGALTALAASLLTEGDAAAEAFGRRAGPVLGAAFALRHARAMAADGRFLLPGLSAADRAALAEGVLTPGARGTVRRLAAGALERLATLRAERSGIDRRARGQGGAGGTGRPTCAANGRAWSARQRPRRAPRPRSCRPPLRWPAAGLGGGDRPLVIG